MTRRGTARGAARWSWQFGPLVYELLTVRRRDGRVHTAVKLGLAAVASGQAVGAAVALPQLRRLEPSLSSRPVTLQSSSYDFTAWWSFFRSFDQWRRMWPGWVGLLALSAWTRVDDGADSTPATRSGSLPAAVALALTVGLGLGARRSPDGRWRTVPRVGIVAIQTIACLVLYSVLHVRRSPHEPERCTA